MKKLSILLIALLAMLTLQPAVAQEQTKKHPHAFFGLQGGGQAVLNGYNLGDVVTGSVGAYVGAKWTPVFGTRLHFNAYQSMEGVEDWGTYKFKYLTGTVDLMANLVSAFNHRDDNTVDFYLIGGVGANKVWGNNWRPLYTTPVDVKNHLAPTVKLGAMLDINFTRNVALNLEVDFNHHGKHDSHIDVNMSRDWQLTGLLGIKFSFPGKAKHVEPAMELIPATVVEPEPVKEVAPAPVVKPEPKPEPVKKAEPATLQQTVFYTISSSALEGENTQKINAVAQWLNQHPAATATIDAYSDRGTGNARVNARVSEARANAVKDALIAAGVKADRLTVKSHGDLEQPFSNNDENRCVIIVAEEK